MIAIISDVHANHDALVAVLQEIDRLEPKAVLCLGDIVGYGPEPAKCVDEVRRRCDVALCGNHDFALIYGANGFSSVARSSIECQREAIMPRPGGAEDNKERWERWNFLKNLPYRHVHGDRLFVHGSPRNPVTEYLRRIDVLLGMSDKINDNFKQVDWICFIGHTHRPGVITPEMEFHEPADINSAFQPKPSHKVIINVGSVGQPRDGDWRACFVTVEDGNLVRFHRVEYDVESTVAKMAATEGTDKLLCDRLRRGK